MSRSMHHGIVNFMTASHSFQVDEAYQCTKQKNLLFCLLFTLVAKATNAQIDLQHRSFKRDW